MDFIIPEHCYIALWSDVSEILQWLYLFVYLSVCLSDVHLLENHTAEIRHICVHVANTMAVARSSSVGVAIC